MNPLYQPSVKRRHSHPSTRRPALPLRGACAFPPAERCSHAHTHRYTHAHAHKRAHTRTHARMRAAPGAAQWGRVGGALEVGGDDLCSREYGSGGVQIGRRVCWTLTGDALALPSSQHKRYQPWDCNYVSIWIASTAQQPRWTSITTATMATRASLAPYRRRLG